jgi:hypothetical protein
VTGLADSYLASLDESNACFEVHLLGRENASVQLQDSWNNFCRDVIFRSWRGGVHTLDGRFIPRRTGDTSPRAALTELRSTYSGKAKKAWYWEPKWFDPIEAIEAASRLGIPNLAEVSAGIGLSPSPLAELRAVRNYFAHRGEQSVSKLSVWVAHPTTDAVHRHVSASTQGGALRFERWVAQLDLMARATVQ